jgi:capsid protein
MRDLGRNNAHARKALTVWTNNLVGPGIMPRAKSGDEALDKAVMDLWEKWSKQADADGQLNIYGLMELAVREMVESGEVLIRKRLRRPEDGLAVPLQLQIMEGDQLDISKVMLNGHNRVINGVHSRFPGSGVLRPRRVPIVRLLGRPSSRPKRS